MVRNYFPIYPFARFKPDTGGSSPQTGLQQMFMGRVNDTNCLADFNLHQEPDGNDPGLGRDFILVVLFRVDGQRSRGVS